MRSQKWDLVPSGWPPSCMSILLAIPKSFERSDVEGLPIEIVIEKSGSPHDPPVFHVHDPVGDVQHAVIVRHHQNRNMMLSGQTLQNIDDVPA